MADEVRFLDVQMLQPNPLQPRGAISQDSLNELANSIKEHGVLEPLVIAHTPAGYQIIAGERRWRASQVAGLTQVPVLIKETTPQGMLEMAIVENVQRTDLNPVDRARAFQRLMHEFHLSSSDIAHRVGKSASYVANSIRLLTLPDALKDGLLSGMISEGHARALAGIDDTHLMVEAYKIILKENGSVRRAEELARRMKSQSGQKTKEAIKPPLVVSKEIDTIRDRLLEKFGGKKSNRVKLTRSRAETKLQIVFKGNLEKTQHRLDAFVHAVEGIDDIRDTTQDSDDPERLEKLG